MTDPETKTIAMKPGQHMTIENESDTPTVVTVEFANGASVSGTTSAGRSMIVRLGDDSANVLLQGPLGPDVRIDGISISEPGAGM